MEYEQMLDNQPNSRYDLICVIVVNLHSVLLYLYVHIVVIIKKGEIVGGL